jgi:hypothetical protein
MPLSVQEFRQIVATANFDSRDIVVNGTGDNANISLGKIGRSSILKNDKVLNASTMAAFRTALQKQFGTLGEDAFESVLGTRTQLGKSLRKSDVEKTLSRLESVKVLHLKNEITRLIETDPRLRLRGPDIFKLIGSGPSDWQLAGMAENCDCSLDSIKAAASRFIDTKVRAFDELDHTFRDRKWGSDVPYYERETPPAATDTLGLSKFKDAGFRSNETSVADRIKSGQMGVGIRVNSEKENPLLFEKLKTTGVEPGFIVRKDWTAADTKSLMVDALALEFAANGKSISSTRDLLLEGMRKSSAPGRGWSAAMAFTAELIMMRDLGRPETALGQAFRDKFPKLDVRRLYPDNVYEWHLTPDRADTIKQIKIALFPQIRDAVMNEQDTVNFPLCKKFAERHIIKLDYNEGDRGFVSSCRSGSAGMMRLPERCSVKGGAFKGFFYQKFRLTTCDKASVEAVAGAFVNDLMRLAGISAQELSIVRGKYSDGHTKLMLQAKFVDGYKDFEDGYIKDGRVFDRKLDESFGRYKAIYLLLADRDAIGSDYQNKGIKDGRFFAMDSGHSLEGYGNKLEIYDDLSFVDKSIVKRFKNFSVFDDSTRFDKFQGVLKLRELKAEDKINSLYSEYCGKFASPEAYGGEKELTKMIHKRLEKMWEEVDMQLDKILNAFDSQLKLYDAVMKATNGNRWVGECAIETIANLEKVTSPTTIKSANKKVLLNHLEVIQKTRIPWSGAYENGNIVYTSSKPISNEAKARLLELLGDEFRDVLTVDEKTGLARVVLTPENRRDLFMALAEYNVKGQKRKYRDS